MILKGTIKQDTTDEVFATANEDSNPTLAILDAAIDSQDPSRIVITSDNEIFDNGKPAKWYIANNVGDKYSVVAINRKQLEVKMWNKDGLETSNILSNCEFEV